MRIGRGTCKKPSARRAFALTVLHFAVHLGDLVPVDQQNDAPDDGVADDKDAGENADRKRAVLQPAVEQIDQDVVGVEHGKLNHRCGGKRQALHLVDGGDARGDERKQRHGENFDGDLDRIDGFHRSRRMQAQVDDCHDDRAARCRTKAALCKSFQKRSHIPILLFSSARHLRETYSRCPP